MRRILAAIAILLATPAMPQENTSPPASASQQSALETGKILPRISCTAHPDQTYALYLPSNYTPNHRWPLIVSSDPGARGTVPLELQKDAAERLGYVLVSSNNSRNGPAKPRWEVTDAMLRDVQMRVSVDTKRIYFAGFSGGARFSAQLAALCKCSAGVLLAGAGFPEGLAPNPDSRFPVFSTVGTFDFNYIEVVPLQGSLEKAGYPHWLRIFEGVHQWPAAEATDEALAWFRIQSMKMQLQPRDSDFIHSQFASALARANSFEQSGDLLNSWREYLQIVGTYDSLVDVTSVRAKAESLGKDKAVRDALKREQNDVQEQFQLTSSIISQLSAPQKRNDDSSTANSDLEQQIFHLRQNAEHEKRPERARVLKRALDSVLVSAVETSNTLLENKDYPAAIRDYQLATQASPQSEWAWRQLAVALTLAGKKKDAFAALRRVREVAHDKANFATWLQSESAFAAIRALPEFQALIL